MNLIWNFAVNAITFYSKPFITTCGAWDMENVKNKMQRCNVFSNNEHYWAPNNVFYIYNVTKHKTLNSMLGISTPGNRCNELFYCCRKSRKSVIMCELSNVFPLAQHHHWKITDIFSRCFCWVFNDFPLKKLTVESFLERIMETTVI